MDTNDGFLIEPPLVVSLKDRDCGGFFQPIKDRTGWKDEEVVTAAIYVGGITLLHGLGWKHLLVLDPQKVAIPGFARHIHGVHGDFLIFDEPRLHLERIVGRYTSEIESEKGAYVLDQVITHILPPFVRITGGDGGGGEELLQVADQIRELIGFRLAA